MPGSGWRLALPTPVVAAWGMGVDSAAMIIELVTRGKPLDPVLTADTGSERPENYDYLPLFSSVG
jgi:3'-phosphoadenosine 5'-phosphosulfate sulfotransferase (PAPS reductase)/FAD synthetase